MAKIIAVRYSESHVVSSHGVLWLRARAPHQPGVICTRCFGEVGDTSANFGRSKMSKFREMKRAHPSDKNE